MVHDMTPETLRDICEKKLRRLTGYLVDISESQRYVMMADPAPILAHADAWEEDKKQLRRLNGEEIDGITVVHLCAGCVGKLEEIVEPLRRRLEEAEKPIDTSTWFYKNCRSQRRRGAKICQVCPFRRRIEGQEAALAKED